MFSLAAGDAEECGYIRAGCGMDLSGGWGPRAPTTDVNWESALERKRRKESLRSYCDEWQ